MIRLLMILALMVPLSAPAEVWDRTNLVKGSDNLSRTTADETVRERYRCTIPSTRTDGESFLPAGIRGIEWKFTNNATQATHSFLSPTCPALIDLLPGTYTLQVRLVLTTDEYNYSAWQTLSAAMVVPLP